MFEFSDLEYENSKEIVKAIKDMEADKREINEKVIKDYTIPGGFGTKIKEAHLGFVEDLNEFKNDIECNLQGWVDWEDERTLAWNNGKFQTAVVDYEATLQEYGEEAVLELDKENEQYVIIWFDEIGRDDNNESIYIYGICNKWDWE